LGYSYRSIFTTATTFSPYAFLGKTNYLSDVLGKYGPENQIGLLIMFYSHYSQILHRLQQLSHTGILRLVENVAVSFREGEVKSLSSHAVSIQPRRLTNSLAYLDADVDACVRLLNAKYTRKWTNIFGGYLLRSEVASGGIGRINRFCNDKTIMQSNRQKKKYQRV